MPQTDAAARQQAAIRVLEVGWSRPMEWLARGLADFLRCPWPGLLHGLVTALFAGALIAVARHRFWVLAGAFSGFLIVAPLVATGLYAVSRELALGRQPTVADSLRVWRSQDRRLIVFGILLALAGTGWVITSASLITGFAPRPVNGPLDFIRHVMLNDQSWLFEGWLLMGALLAAPVFASSVVAMPMLLDSKVGVWTAVLTSWRTVLASPVALAHWAFIIAFLVGLAMATLMVGLVFIVPALAHASWHAYRQMVQLPPELQRDDQRLAAPAGSADRPTSQPPRRD